MKKVYALILLFYFILHPLLVYAAPTATADLTFGASVSPQPSDLNFTFTSDTNDSVTLPQSKEINYTIQYKSTTSGPFPLVLQASWGKGLISGSSQYIDILEYVVNSATTSDDGTVPVINLQDRTITWNIPALKPSITHSVTFKLKVPSTIVTDKQIVVRVKTQAEFGGVTIPQSEIVHNVQWDPSLVIPGPTATPMAVPTVSVKPPLPVFPSFTSVNIKDISDTSATISFSTTQPTRYTILYGTKSNELSQKVEILQYTTSHGVILNGLKEKTVYFFQLVASNEDNRTARSDIFTFETASHEDTIPVDTSSLSIYSDRTLLSSEKITALVVPQGMLLNFHLRVDNMNDVRYIHASFQDIRVLGATTLLPEEEESTFVEALPGVMTARLQVPDLLGTYQLYLKIKMKSGTFTTKVTPYTFYVSKPITIINAKTKQPIEGAFVSINTYQPGPSSYQPIETKLSLDSETNPAGELRIVLPANVYKLKVNALGYTEAEKEIKLGINDFEYPTIALTPHFGFQNTVKYFYNATRNTLQTCAVGLENLVSSQKFFSAFIVICIIVECITLMWSLVAFRSPRKNNVWFMMNVLLQSMALSIFAFSITVIVFALMVQHKFSETFVLITLLVAYCLHLYFILSRFWKVIQKNR
jgi:hypothetical protein